MPRILTTTEEIDKRLQREVEKLQNKIYDLEGQIQELQNPMNDEDPDQDFLIPFRRDDSESHSTKAIYEGPGGAIIYIELPLGDRWDLLKHLNTICSGRIE